MLQQKALAFRRQFRIDGEISRARKVNPQHGNDLLPALLHHDGDKFVWLDRAAKQFLFDPASVTVDLAIGETPIGRADGQLLGTFRHLLEKGSVQQIAGQWRCRVVGGVTQGDLRSRDQPPRIFRKGSLPGGIVRGQILQQSLVRSKHIVQETSGKKFLYRITVDLQGAFFLVHHKIEIHLGRLRNGIDALAKPAGPGQSIALIAKIQQARKNDGHDGRRSDALKARQVPHHLNSTEVTMIQILPEPFLLLVHARRKSRRRGIIHLQQIHRREVADDGIRLRMQGQTVEQSKVHREARSFCSR